MPTINKDFCSAVLKATARIQKAREERDSCPREQGGCGRRGSLHSVSRRGITSGKLCPHCGWSTFFLAEAKGRAKAKGASRRKKGGA